MIRQDFKELPPASFLMQVMDNLTKTYVSLWSMQDRENSIELTWKEISKHYQKNSFRSHVRKLSNTGLLNYLETDRGISIEMVAWEDIDV